MSAPTDTSKSRTELTRDYLAYTSEHTTFLRQILVLKLLAEERKLDCPNEAYIFSYFQANPEDVALSGIFKKLEKLPKENYSAAEKNQMDFVQGKDVNFMKELKDADLDVRFVCHSMFRCLLFKLVYTVDTHLMITTASLPVKNGERNPWISLTREYLERAMQNEACLSKLKDKLHAHSAEEIGQANYFQLFYARQVNSGVDVDDFFEKLEEKLPTENYSDDEKAHMEFILGKDDVFMEKMKDAELDDNDFRHMFRSLLLKIIFKHGLKSDSEYVERKLCSRKQYSLPYNLPCIVL